MCRAPVSIFKYLMTPKPWEKVQTPNIVSWPQWQPELPDDADGGGVAPTILPSDQIPSHSPPHFNKV